MPMPAIEARAWVQRGVAHLQAGRAAAARDTFQHLVQAGPPSADAHLGLAHAQHLLGQRELAMAAVTAALALQPRHIAALVLKGDWLDAAGESTAASFYQAALTCADALDAVPMEWQASVAQAQNMCARYAKHFEDTLHAQLAQVAPQQGPPSPRFSHALDLLTGRKALYPSAPRLFLFPELPTVQFYDRSHFPWLADLEAATADIRRELLAVLAAPQDFSPYVQSDPSRPLINQGGLLDNPDWSAYFLWKNGQRIDTHANRCPATVAALAALPVVYIPSRSPSVLFSLLRPGAHIPAHHGFVNTRLIVHLPLIVPPGCRFRVGNDTREWVEGQAWLFDDTIEHEAWNPSNQTRVILLFEVWRPEFTANERAYVSALFEAIDKQRGGQGEWGI